MRVNVYTDGACIGNPGKGGYGIIMEWVGKPYIKEFSEGFRLTTNNRMELLAVIVALEQLKKENTLLFASKVFFFNLIWFDILGRIISESL